MSGVVANSQQNTFHVFQTVPWGPDTSNTRDHLACWADPQSKAKQLQHSTHLFSQPADVVMRLTVQSQGSHTSNQRRGIFMMSMAKILAILWQGTTRATAFFAKVFTLDCLAVVPPLFHAETFWTRYELLCTCCMAVHRRTSFRMRLCQWQKLYLLYDYYITCE